MEDTNSSARDADITEESRDSKAVKRKRTPISVITISASEASSSADEEQEGRKQHKGSALYRKRSRREDGDNSFRRNLPECSLAAGAGEIVPERHINVRSQTFRAGQLNMCYHRWASINAPPYILSIINGYRIPFKVLPPLYWPNFLHQTPQSEETTKIIEKMLEQGVLEVAIHSPSFISNIHVRVVSDGTLRPFFNLKKLNEFVFTRKHKMRHCGPDFLQPSDWLAKINLYEACFHLPIAKTHRRFLRFIYANKLLEMTCLPVELGSSSKAVGLFTDCIGKYLTSQGVRILIHMDELLLVNQNPNKLHEHIELTRRTLDFLGLSINAENSILSPQTALEFHGVKWDPWNNLKCLSDTVVTSIEAQVSAMLSKEETTLYDLQKIISLMNFASYVISRGRLNYRSLEAKKNEMLQLSNSTTCHLSQNEKSDLNWWVQNCRKKYLIFPPLPEHCLTTDASNIGWGAKLDNLSLQGEWTIAQQHLDCSKKEMIAILNVLLEHGPMLEAKSIIIQCDNLGVIKYLQRQGGKRSIALTDLTAKIFQVLDQFNIYTSFHYLPGKYNCDADRLSRKKTLPEWHLLPLATEIIFRKWGIPDVDLFASSAAHVVPNYCSLDSQDKSAAFHDALSVKWDFTLAWVFPPPHLIPRVITQLNNASGIFLVVVPSLYSAFWTPYLKIRAMEPPYNIPNLPQVLVNVKTGIPPRKTHKMNLQVWKCWGGTQIES